MNNIEQILIELQENGKYISLSLWPQQEKTIIEGEGNRMLINDGRLGKFDNISESFYDKMVNKYDSRYKTK